MEKQNSAAYLDESNVRGYLVKPPGGPAPLVVVFMEIWGVNDHMRVVGEKLAGLGFAAFVLDFYDGALFAPPDIQGAAAKFKAVGDEGVMDAFGRAVGFLKHARTWWPTGLASWDFATAVVWHSLPRHAIRTTSARPSLSMAAE